MSARRLLSGLAIAALLSAPALATAQGSGGNGGGAPGALTVTSPKFQNGGELPQLYTCAGSNINPPLTWSAGPRGTKSYALLVVDPDAPDPPQRGYTHWIVFDIPATARSIKENARKESDFPPGTREGVNDARMAVYGAPCPPSGTHRYEFKVFALDTRLDQLEGPTRVELEDAMRGHVLASGEIVGTFRRK